MARKTSGPPAIVVRKCPSKSGSGTYEVRISRIDGKMWCNCRGWKFNKSCTHTQLTTIDDVLAALENACKTGVLGI